MEIPKSLVCSLGQICFAIIIFEMTSINKKKVNKKFYHIDAKSTNKSRLTLEYGLNKITFHKLIHKDGRI